MQVILSTPGRRPTLLFRSERADFRFALRVLQVAQFGADSARDGGGLAGILEASEVGAIAPGEWTAEPLSGRQRGIVHHVDEPFVIGFALPVAGEVAEVSRGREYRVHSGN